MLHLTGWGLNFIIIIIMQLLFISYGCTFAGDRTIERHGAVPVRYTDTVRGRSRSSILLVLLPVPPASWRALLALPALERFGLSFCLWRGPSRVSLWLSRVCRVECRVCPSVRPF